MLIKGASLLQNGSLLKDQDILIEDNRISKIGQNLRDEEVMDAHGKLAIPGLVNGHTHLAMTLLRGYADDMELMSWLKQKIWPLESLLKPQDIRCGVKLGCLELIRFGVTCYNDMYYFMDDTARATREMGLRAVLSGVVFDMRPELLKEVEPFLQRWKDDPLIRPAVGPHAIYTCSEETLLQAGDLARRHEVMMHIHLSETRQEVEDCMMTNGSTPVEYLESMGLLGPGTGAAHCVWLSPRDIRILGERKVNVFHNPVSNLKLASGVAPVVRLLEAGANVCLGTDGASSNNNLSIFEEMKVAAVLQKNYTGQPTALPAPQAWQMATENAYRAFGLNMGLREGALADLVLIDLHRPWFKPETNMISHLVYSMAGGVDTTIVNGRVLMRDGIIPGEEKIMLGAEECFRDLISR
ncbi:MAG: amidohydrolase [Methanosarcinales archaeon]|nr:amidohydrolase [Methanosarcinales archaeon]